MMKIYDMVMDGGTVQRDSKLSSHILIYEGKDDPLDVGHIGR